MLEAAARARGGEGSYVRIDGGVSLGERGARVEAFQRDAGRRVALLGATAAGTGLTLTAASAVVFAELLWSPSRIQQARVEPSCGRAATVTWTVCTGPACAPRASGSRRGMLFPQRAAVERLFTAPLTESRPGLF